MRFAVVGSLVFVLFTIVGAMFLLRGKTHLRGNAEESPDGKTYLIIADDNGGAACQRVKVNGQDWPYGLHEKGPIAPGTHSIECGGKVSIVIPSGTTFRFDYWGP
jgi:hypothetical protein